MRRAGIARKPTRRHSRGGSHPNGEIRDDSTERGGRKKNKQNKSVYVRIKAPIQNKQARKTVALG